MMAADQLALTVQAAAVLAPVAVYFFLLGLLNSQPRPQLLSARTDFLLLNTALLPMFVLPALSYLGVSIWALLAVVGGMLAAAVVLAPPRLGHWVIYNIALPDALRAAERVLKDMGLPFRRRGRQLQLQGRDARLRLGSVALLRNVSISAEGADVRRLARPFAARLDAELGRVRTQASPMAVTLLLLATAMLVAPLGLFADRMPEVVRILTDLVR